MSFGPISLAPNGLDRVIGIKQEKSLQTTLHNPLQEINLISPAIKTAARQTLTQNPDLTSTQCVQIVINNLGPETVGFPRLARHVHFPVV